MATKKKTPPPVKQTAIILEDMIPLPEAAALADVSEAYLRRLVNAGKVTGFKLGRNYLVSRSSAAAFDRHPTAGRPRGS